MNIYQIIGAIWGVNSIILIVLIVETDDSHKYFQYINKFIAKHIGIFAACYISTFAIIVWLLRIGIE